MQINNYIFFSLAGMTNLLLLMIIFFSKERLKSKENSFYILLMFCTLIGIINEIIMVYCVPFLEQNIIIKESIAKLFLIICELWTMLLCNYTMIVSSKMSKKDDKSISKQQIFLFIIYIISAVITCLLPIEYAYNETNTSWLYTYGLSTKAVFVVGITYILISLYYILKNKHSFKNKKFIPIYCYIALSTAVAFLQQIDPSILMISFSETLVITLMYFTIENPDVKMLAQVENARDIAEKANRAKSDFLSSMSHEIRTPLNAIVGMSEDISDYEGELPPQIKEDASDIQMASQTLLEIVGNILDISKIESEKMELVEVEYDFKKEIESLAKIDATRIGEKPIDFKVTIAEDIPDTLYGDKIHMKQIVNNLLSNAIKYTEQGTISLNIKCINKLDQCNLIISIQDTGRGIKPEYINKLFNKFERLDIERNTTTEGTGLGLAITKSLVEMMGGNINVQSQFGKGSIFVVQINQKIVEKDTGYTAYRYNAQTKTIETIEPGKTEQNIREQVINNSVNVQRKVLIVDDNNLNIKVAIRALSNLPVEVESVTSGQACIDKINNGEKFDIILMDIMMPEMSGESALKILKSNPNFNIPVVALTADAIAGAEEKYLNEGFVSYLAKPFSKDQIKELLDKIFK